MIRQEEDACLLAQAAAWPDKEWNLVQVTQDQGLDFATALLYERIRINPLNAAFARQVDRAGMPSEIPVDIIGVVPGAFHREHRDTGADGSRVLSIAATLGCNAEVIPTVSCGTLDENARIILEWLIARRGRRIALISLSKGGADLKQALYTSAATDAFASVTAWVNISGILQGTPLVDWLRRRPLRWWAVRLWLWWKGYSGRSLEELAHGPGNPLASWPALPAHMRLVHVCGFPLAHHLAHTWAPRGYARLSPLGPNDGGGILLGDLLHVPGIVYPIWGADHYLAPGWDILPLLTKVIATAFHTRIRDVR